MEKVNLLYNRESLLQSLQHSHQLVRRTFKSLSLDDLYARASADTWSPFETLAHLIKCVKPLVLALRLPKFVLALLYKKHKQPSRRYEVIQEAYQNMLARGAQAGRFAPEYTETPATQEDAEAYRHKILKTWTKTADRLTKTVERWYEKDLDRYQLPHPHLGKLTIREMLMFTIYHNLYHANRVQKAFRNPEKNKPSK